MNHHTSKLMVCAVLWTTVFGLAVAGSFPPDLRLMFWSLVVALVACMVTGHLVAECAARRAVRDERIRMETLVELMIAQARAVDQDLPRVPTGPRR